MAVPITGIGKMAADDYHETRPETPTISNWALAPILVLEYTYYSMAYQTTHSQSLRFKLPDHTDRSPHSIATCNVGFGFDNKNLVGLVAPAWNVGSSYWLLYGTVVSEANMIVVKRRSFHHGAPLADVSSWLHATALKRTTTATTTTSATATTTTPTKTRTSIS